MNKILFLIVLLSFFVSSGCGQNDLKTPACNTNPVSGIATVQPGQVPQEVVRWLNNDSTGVCPVSVNFMPANPVVAPSTDHDIIRPFVRIKFGTHDSTSQFDADIGAGGQVTLTASVIYVSVGMAVDGTVAYELEALVGTSPLAKMTTLTRTLEKADEVASPFGGPTTLVRPAYVNSMMFERWPQSEYLLTFSTLRQQLAYQRIIKAGEVLTSSIPIADDILFIYVQNQDSPGSENYRAIFSLDL